MGNSEQYNEICKANFDKMQNTLDSIDKRLFKDNGTKSIQTCLNELKAWQVAHEEPVKSKDTSDDLLSWIKKYWKNIGVIAFFLVWLGMQVRLTSNYTEVDQARIQEMLKTMIKKAIVNTNK